jgi:hypothetical protein
LHLVWLYVIREEIEKASCKEDNNLKRIVLTIVLLLTMIFVVACGKNAEDGASVSEDTSTATEDSSNADSREVLVYIKGFDDKTVEFDEVEWVEIPSERATELGLSESDDSGFSVYNETEDTKEISIAEDCVYTILDWTNNYESIKITPNEFMSVLDERNNTLASLSIDTLAEMEDLK